MPAPQTGRAFLFLFVATEGPISRRKERARMGHRVHSGSLGFLAGIGKILGDESRISEGIQPGNSTGTWRR